MVRRLAPQMGGCLAKRDSRWPTPRHHLVAVADVLCRVCAAIHAGKRTDRHACMHSAFSRGELKRYHYTHCVVLAAGSCQQF